jgi:hypothetical protein
MRTKFAVSTVICGAVLLGSGAAYAAGGGSPHFIKHATSASLSGSDLVVSFKEAGLPSGATETIQLTATASVSYECVNGGNKNPSASNKRTTQTGVSTSSEFTADKNGNVTGSLSVAPPSAASVGFTCPPGQTVTFVSVTYGGVTISDLDSGATTSFGSLSLTYTNPDAP